LPSDDRDLIDQVLLMLYGHHYRLLSSIFPDAFRPLAISDLRAGPLSWDLGWLDRYARGEVSETGARVRTAVESILAILLWPPGADEYTVPRSFWDTPVGRLLMAAKNRSFPADELVDLADAAERLGVGRATVLRWVDDKILDFVIDGLTGRTFVARRDVEFVLRITKELSLERPGQVRT